MEGYSFTAPSGKRALVSEYQNQIITDRGGEITELNLIIREIIESWSYDA